MTKISIAFAAALALLSAPAANAAVLLDQSFNPGGVQTGANFNQETPTQWDDFSVAAATAVSYVETWGSHWSSGAIPADESFTVYVNDYAGVGTLGAAVGTSATTQLSRVDTGFDHNDIRGRYLALQPDARHPDRDRSGRVLDFDRAQRRRLGGNQLDLAAGVDQ